MTTGSSTHSHQVTIGGKIYSTNAKAHTHSETPDPDAAAIADLTTRVAALEAAQPIPPPSRYTLELEFDGSTIDPRIAPLWAPTDTGDRLDTDQQQSVTLQQISQTNSILSLNADRKPTPSGRPFAGACVATFGTFSQRYGTWEARISFPECKGSFPSWFFLPVGQKGPYPEVDVFEAYGDMACQGPGYVGTAVSTSTTANDHKAFIPVSLGWHVHKFVWTPTRYDFFIDGVNTWSVTNPALISQVPMYPIFTHGYGAPNPGCHADATTPNHTQMDIDYLRVSA